MIKLCLVVQRPTNLNSCAYRFVPVYPYKRAQQNYKNFSVQRLNIISSIDQSIKASTIKCLQTLVKPFTLLITIPYVKLTMGQDTNFCYHPRIKLIRARAQFSRLQIVADLRYTETQERFRDHFSCCISGLSFNRKPSVLQ